MSEPKKKKFDCVQMKHEIQQRILAEWEHLTPEEQKARTREILNRDDGLGRLWRSARRAEHPTRKVS